jgi:AAA domain
MADRAMPASMTGNQRKLKIVVPEPILDDPDNKYTDYWGQLKNGNGAAEYASGIKLDAWLKRKIPPRDYLLGHLLCTTSRCLIIGDTGVGKTLWALEMAAAISAFKGLLAWQPRRRARVMYLDGELPDETLKERLQLVASRYGGDLDLWVYNRDVVEMPPLNTSHGRTWLFREIDAISPDIIFFDSIMCLVDGDLTDPDHWVPINELLGLISAKHIGQVWLHHTGHDATRGFGTKTREWKMDIVMMLTKVENGADVSSDTTFNLEFKKARLRNGKNFKEFMPLTVTHTDEGFSCTQGLSRTKGSRGVDVLQTQFKRAYEKVVDGIKPTPGFDGMPVKKVHIDKIRDELKTRGFLDKDEKKGSITGKARVELKRAKDKLLASGEFVQDDELIWRIRRWPA